MDKNRELIVPQYEIEIWSWKNGAYQADISNILTSDLQIEWVLNDVETVNFSIDLIQFETKCKLMNATAASILTPYVHDIRIKRNGLYIIGCQLVEANINISNDTPPTIDIKCTGFLNIFKDQYITESWGGYTYAEIARKLILFSQRGTNLVKNPTGDIDVSYWLCTEGVMARSTNGHSGSGCISVTRVSSLSSVETVGTQIKCPSGTQIYCTFYCKCGGYTPKISIGERSYISDESTDRAISSNVSVSAGTWSNQIFTYTTTYENPYIVVKATDSNYLSLDDFYIFKTSDNNSSYNNMMVSLGTDTASVEQSATRSVNYQLQNVKDELMNLTCQQEDNFDFDFSPDRTFNCYDRKGSYKPEVGLTYPGNIHSMTITRSAANLANKIINIGSGIGDERLEVITDNGPSRSIYGTRQSVVTRNNVQMEQTLLTEGVGELWDRKDPTNLPKITIRNGSVNPSNLQVGDSVYVTVAGDEYLNTINGEYRVIKYGLSVDQDNIETVNLTLEPPVQRPEPYYIRYIKDRITKNTKNNSKHWVMIQALMLVDGQYIDMAYGITPTYTTNNVNDPSAPTDGSLSTYSGITPDGTEAIIIDLGGLYPIDYIKVWHYFADDRSYYGNELSVGPELVSGTTALEYKLWSYGTSTKAYRETSSGRQSKWIQGKNM